MWEEVFIRAAHADHSLPPDTRFHLMISVLFLHFYAPLVAVQRQPWSESNPADTVAAVMNRRDVFPFTIYQ